MISELEFTYRGRYRLILYFKDGGGWREGVWAESQEELTSEAKRVINEVREWDGRAEEVERVYSTRIDCSIQPVERQAA